MDTVLIHHCIVQKVTCLNQNGGTLYINFNGDGKIYVLP